VDILRELFYGLTGKDKSKFQTSKKVADIQSIQDGVQVSCDDGTTYEGSIVIGADGVHSIVRQKMRSLALEASAKAEVNDTKPFVAEYKILWCSIPPRPEFKKGTTFETHGKNVALQLFNRDEGCFLFLYERLAEPTKERTFYTQADIESCAERLTEMAVTGNLKVKDLFPTRYNAGMANLEEGYLHHWSWERIVLVGDAVRKYAPNNGTGYNNGIQDVVVLANELHRALSSSPDGDSLSQEQLATVFSQYQSLRFVPTEKALTASKMMIRTSTWNNWFYWLMDWYILPTIPSLTTSRINKLSLDFVSKSYVLDFISGEEPFEGTIPWAHRIPARKPKDATLLEDTSSLERREGGCEN
jgi:2-polyprenyl-6-methoxyphenol hydroxylase-like FAD-dependent oxidoreductase